MKKKKVLIVGGAGYIGGYTTDYLINNNYNVTVYDKLIYENRYLKNVDFIYGDIRDTDKLVEIANNFDVIILMAALVGDPACSVDVDLTYEINYEAIKNFTQKINKTKHIVFMSTCSVYGAQHEILTETSDTNPLSTYATTKLLAEEYILKNNGTVFRLGTVYGVGDTYSRIRLDLIVNVLTMKSIKDNEINIFGGDQWRPLICVKDIAGYIEESIRHDIRGVYILSEDNYKIKDLGLIVKEVFPNIKINYSNISFEDARNYKVDNSKMLKTFKYRVLHNIKDEVFKLKNILEEHRISDFDSMDYNNGMFIKNNYMKLNITK